VSIQLDPRENAEWANKKVGWRCGWAGQDGGRGSEGGKRLDASTAGTCTARTKSSVIHACHNKDSPGQSWTAQWVEKGHRYR